MLPENNTEENSVRGRFQNIQDIFDRQNIPIMHPRVKKNLDPIISPITSRRRSET